MIVIGIDPHKASLTAVAVSGSGKQLADRRFDVNAGTLRQLCKWARRWSQHRFAVEGAWAAESCSSWPPAAPMSSMFRQLWQLERGC